MLVKILLVTLCLTCIIEARGRKKKLNNIDNKDDFKKKKSDVEVTSVVTDIKSAKNIGEVKNEKKDTAEETNENKDELVKRDEIPHEEETNDDDDGEKSEIRSPKRMRIDSAEEDEDYEEASTTSSGEDFSGNGDEGSDLISVKLNKDEMTLLHAIEALSKRQSIEKTSKKEEQKPKRSKIRKATKKQHIAHHFKRTKQCEKVRRCSMPMTYAECAIPRCREKVRPVRGLCFWLCKHQKKHCTTVCE